MPNYANDYLPITIGGRFIAAARFAERSGTVKYDRPLQRFDSDKPVRVAAMTNAVARSRGTTSPDFFPLGSPSAVAALIIYWKHTRVLHRLSLSYLQSFVGSKLWAMEY